MKLKKWSLVVVWMITFAFIGSIGTATAFAGAKQSNADSHDQGKTAVEWYNEGVGYHDRYLYDRAIQAYTKALELDNQATDAYFNRAHAYAEKKNYAAAVKDFQQVIKLAPEEIDAYYNIGVVYDDQELYDQALVYYNKTIAMDAQYYDAYYNKAIALENLGRTAEAKAAYAAFIQYAPANDVDLPIAKERMQILSRS